MAAVIRLPFGTTASISIGLCGLGKSGIASRRGGASSSKKIFSVR